MLSIVDNVQDELDRIEEENSAPAETIVEKAMFGGAGESTSPVADDSSATNTEDLTNGQ